MPKVIKGLASRTPPVANADETALAEWVGRQMPGLQPLVAELDALVRETLPGLEYAISHNHAYYGLAKLGWIIELAPYSKSANVLFLAGADFKSPPPLGDTDRTRYVKLTELDDALRKQLVGWIREAKRLPGWK